LPPLRRTVARTATNGAVLARAESARSALRWNQRTKSMLPQL